MASDEKSENKDSKRVTTADVRGENAAFTSVSEVDTAAKLAAGVHDPLDPAEAQRIRCVHLNVCITVRVLTAFA